MGALLPVGTPERGNQDVMARVGPLDIHPRQDKQPITGRDRVEAVVNHRHRVV
jgi:hypothetical protein